MKLKNIIKDKKVIIQIQQLLPKFSKRERKILTIRLGLEDGIPHTLRDVAKHLGITRERVRQIENIAMKKLRECIIQEHVNEERERITAHIDNLSGLINYKLLNMPLSELEFSVRTSDCLRRAGIKRISDLVLKSEMDLLKIRNFGKSTLMEIKKILENMGLSLRSSDLFG